MSSSTLVQICCIATLVACISGCGSAAPKAETTPELAGQAADEAAAPKWKKPAFEEVDADGDGFATADEINAVYFKMIDTDGDGKISGDEHAAHRAMHKSKGHGKGSCPHCAKKKAECPECAKHPKGECPHCAKKKAEHPHGGHGHHKRMQFEDVDANADGFVTMDEFKKGEWKVKKKDKDEDGKLTREEYEASHKKPCHCHQKGERAAPAETHPTS